MARKAKKSKAQEPPPPAVDDATEEESVRDDDASMDAEDDGPDIVVEDKDDEEKPAAAKPKVKKSKKAAGASNASETSIPFLDTFYHLSSEDSPADRSVAARDLIRHCFPSSDSYYAAPVNAKDAAYALTRLLNGLCTGRAASRQGFASCLASFLRVSHASGALGEVLEEDDFAAKLKNERGEDIPLAAIVREKLLTTTEFQTDDDGNKAKTARGEKKDARFGGKMKGIEERDHAFGRLFGVLAVVRSGVLGTKDFPSTVVEGYATDLIDLYHYKKWMREPSAHAVIELLSSLDAESHSELIASVANNVIVPKLFLHPSLAEDGADLSVRAQWLTALTPEQIAVALHLQTPPNDAIKHKYPLDEPLVTAESVPQLAAALSATSSVVYPRCHFVWNALWAYLTEENDDNDHRVLRSGEEFSSVVESVVNDVLIDVILGKGEGSTAPTHERRSLALQVVCALSGSSNLRIALPPALVGNAFSPQVVTRVFVNVLCASGGKKQKKEGVEHHLKPLTSQALADLVDDCCEHADVDRQMALAKAFLSTDPRFDTKTKTQTVSSLLMMGNNEAGNDHESQREALWHQYLSFLEEEVVSATSLHNATVHIELMYKLAKRSVTQAPANEARRVLRFFMSGAFFDCSGLADPPAAKKKPSKKKKKAAATGPPQELSSGLRIAELLQQSDLPSISHPARAIMAARFYSLLSDFISMINSQNRGGHKDKPFYGKGSKPESIYRTLSEISGICSLMETSGAKLFQAPPTRMDMYDASDAEDPMEATKKLVLQVQNIANDALVKECDGSDGEENLRAKSVFATGCASLMMSLFLQLNSCGNSESVDEENGDDDEEDVAEAVHEYISDLADCVDGFLKVIEGTSDAEGEENPLAAMAGLLVNILSSPVGGEGSGKTNPIQASASKLTRETVKLAWSGVISVITSLNTTNESLKSLVDEDVMTILIESVCGEKSMADDDDGEGDDAESIEESVSSADELDDGGVFNNASQSGMDLDEVNDDQSDSSEDSKDQDSKDDSDDEGDDDVELDPAKLENLLLEDSDAEMSDSGILEHHAGADKALAQLIKLKQEARKASQTERERVDLCNRLRCCTLLESLFSASVIKGGWLPVEAVLGSIVPILRSRKAMAKSIQASSSANTKKSLSEKTAIMERLSALVKDKLSKFRCSDDSTSEELVLKASSDIYDEIKHSLNVAHCSCASVGLITTIRCISNVEENDVVKAIYAGAVEDWSTRKATKIHACVFEDLIKRMPSLAALVLVEPLMKSARDAHSSFLKCESIKLLSAMYKHNPEEHFSSKAKDEMKKCCSKVAVTLNKGLIDSGLQKAKHRDEVLVAIKHFVHFLKAQDEGILTESEITALQASLKAANCKSGGMKQLCKQVAEEMSGLKRREDGDDQKPKRSKAPKTPKTSKKPKKSTTAKKSKK